MSGPVKNAPGIVRDERTDQLERTGYLLVVYADRLVRAVAALVLRIGRFAVKQIVTRRQMGDPPSASRTRF